LLRPDASVKSIRRYSQQFVDLINLEENSFQSLPVAQALDPHSPELRYLVMVDQGDYLAPLRILLQEDETNRLVVTFDELLRRTPFARRMSQMLQILEKEYTAPVDTEFTVRILNPKSAQPEVEISLLQCRPQSHLKGSEARLPTNLPEEDIIFSTSRMAPEGRVDQIQLVIFVSPEGYFSLPSSAARAELGRAISQVNAALKGESFICVGPGRWGTSSPDLGVRIGYGDIYNTRALVELTGNFIGTAPEPSFGTHFFQDLVESNIYPLAIDLRDSDVVFDRTFFYDTPNLLEKVLPEHAGLKDSLRVIRVADFRQGHHLELVMDDRAGKTVAFLEAEE
jgi:hypothetical protein